MKRILVALATMAIVCAGCIEDERSGWKATIRMPDGSVKAVDVGNWRRSNGSNGNCVQITSSDGTVYVVHYSNVMLEKRDSK